MTVQDLNGVFINHIKIDINKNGNEYAAFSIAFTEQVGGKKFKTSFIDGITSYKNIVAKLKNSNPQDRFVFEGKLKYQTWKDANGKQNVKHVVEVQKLTKIEKEVYNDPYANPGSPLLQEDKYEQKNQATPAHMIGEGDLNF